MFLLARAKELEADWAPELRVEVQFVEEVRVIVISTVDAAATWYTLVIFIAERVRGCTLKPEPRN